MSNILYTYIVLPMVSLRGYWNSICRWWYNRCGWHHTWPLLTNRLVIILFYLPLVCFIDLVSWLLLTWSPKYGIAKDSTLLPSKKKGASDTANVTALTALHRHSISPL